MDTMTKSILWIAGIIAIVGTIFVFREKVVDYRENRRGWRLWVVHPFFRYLERDERGLWSPIDFETTWEPLGHGYVLKSILIPSAANWFTSPSWALSRRNEIIANLKEAYPENVVFVETEFNLEQQG
ncbi:hypothetical protein ESB00_09280 [Oleiharenicola lentus]|jgi:hypothetical protein|uniref:Uncharacterized protein n=1 Tax=Oleiharenicola lentus TaxID=2508720 RepID=A0A4Q1CAZ4_9BACT|nr:hypothetical protein [Oleiharenicola lentus]RXK56052.1 hypothetical protein ESB00_09280 [Oleiharenicola lentus]